MSIIIVAALIIGYFKDKQRRTFYSAVGLFAAAFTILASLNEDIYFYIPKVHNEQFVLLKCVIIYISFAAIILSAVSIIAKIVNKKFRTLVF